MNGGEGSVHLFGKHPMGRKTQRGGHEIPVEITTGTAIIPPSGFKQ